MAPTPTEAARLAAAVKAAVDAAPPLPDEAVDLLSRLGFPNAR